MDPQRIQAKMFYLVHQLVSWIRIFVFNHKLAAFHSQKCTIDNPRLLELYELYDWMKLKHSVLSTNRITDVWWSLSFSPIRRSHVDFIPQFKRVFTSTIKSSRTIEQAPKIMEQKNARKTISTKNLSMHQIDYHEFNEEFS
jgi:hypothetical protein